MNENERPAIGSSEAAVLTVVELIARAANMSEQHLAYWLDLYYQVRSRHEKDMTPLDFSELMVKVEEPDPVRVQLDRIEEMLDGIRRRQTDAHAEEPDLVRVKLDRIEDKLNEILDHWKHRYDAADAAAFALAGIVPTPAPAQGLTLTADDLKDFGAMTEVVNDAIDKAAGGPSTPEPAAGSKKNNG